MFTNQINYNITHSGADPFRVRRVLKVIRELRWRRRFVSRAINAPKATRQGTRRGVATRPVLNFTLMKSSYLE